MSKSIIFGQVLNTFGDFCGHTTCLYCKNHRILLSKIILAWGQSMLLRMRWPAALSIPAPATTPWRRSRPSVLSCTTSSSPCRPVNKRRWSWWRTWLASRMTWRGFRRRAEVSNPARGTLTHLWTYPEAILRSRLPHPRRIYLERSVGSSPFLPFTTLIR